MDAFEEWLKDRAEDLHNAFIIIREMVRELPLPIILPELEVDGEPNREAVPALYHALTLMAEEPIPAERQRAYEHLLTEWFTAYEVVVLIGMAGPVPWRVKSVEFTLQRLRVLLHLIETDEITNGES